MELSRSQSLFRCRRSQAGSASWHWRRSRSSFCAARHPAILRLSNRSGAFSPAPGGNADHATRTAWQQVVVLGVNEGILSTASLVPGVAGAHGSGSHVLVAGVAGLVAVAMAMAGANPYRCTHRRTQRKPTSPLNARNSNRSDGARTDRRSADRRVGSVAPLSGAAWRIGGTDWRHCDDSSRLARDFLASVGYGDHRRRRRLVRNGRMSAAAECPAHRGCHLHPNHGRSGCNCPKEARI